MEAMVTMRGIRKEFPGVVAVDNVDFETAKGEVMGLLGENGAGKSTLLNILYGLYRADAGSIEVDGKPVKISSSKDAINHGIGMVHQAFTLVPNLTVRENIILGFEPSSHGVLDEAKARKTVDDLIGKTGLGVDQDELIENLPTGFKQRVEILKALFRGAKVLILDEPTSVLTPLEVDELFKSIRRLIASGATVIFITHKLKEVMQITNRITVMRRGRVVGSLDTKDASYATLAKMMVGRDIERKFAFAEYKPGKVLLEVKGLCYGDKHKLDAVKDVSFDVREGEIVSLAGVEGNGQTELVESIMGLKTPTMGTVEVKGTAVGGLGPNAILEHSVAHIPEDRALRGLVMDFSVAENTVLGSVDRPQFSKSGLLSVSRVREFARNIVKSFNIATPSIDTQAKTLSGGNQQKLIVGRELSSSPELLIAHQPTRGLDVGSTEYIQSLLVDARNKGRGVLLVSADFDEVLDLSDRILVMYEGKIIGELKRGARIEELGRLLGGVRA
ncbi:MAG: ABC transporter ATP-binding protein [Nitrososphaerota archaeon]|nr:ABC transporter ATP-binding protein [Nitrososphaerota archaeon]MDG7023267.1 ABC transporter ATP-binding protein [Nitrososphaerota archaeon]